MGRKSGYPSNKRALLVLIADTGHGRSPSVRWIADELEVGVATAHSYLELMAEEGLIEWTPRQHRSIRLTLKGSQVLQSSAAQPV